MVVNYRRMPDKSGEMKPTPLTPQEVQQINNLVKEAMGYNSGRGDTLNVVNAAFADNAQPVTMQERVIDYVSGNGTSLVKYGLLGIAVLYLLFGVVRPIMRDLVRPPAPAAGAEGEAAAAGAAGPGGRLLAWPGKRASPASPPRWRAAEKTRAKRRSASTAATWKPCASW
ncbi:Flagellar M-ring protein [Chromobacterium violaceum]|uniref:Flagellar M-ring protein n=1 Tax=Chromobacterium violaceum TaxID=536 RepID=A0A447TGX5_CHRVL|nr:Flagellar M-ring protein [Chromobacterium violaceum]